MKLRFLVCRLLRTLLIQVLILSKHGLIHNVYLFIIFVLINLLV